MAEGGIQVIDRVFDIIELLAEHEAGLGVTEIARRLDLNKTTVHIIVNGILKRGYVEKTSEGLYRLGLKFVAVSSHRLNSIELSTEARPYLMELTNQLGQCCHLAILDGCDAVYIDKVEIARNLRLYSQIGKRIPVYCSALGKSLLIDKEDWKIAEVLQACDYEPLTRKTIRSPQVAFDQIMEARITGWTIDDEEHDEGIRCFSAPIYDYTGVIIAAISTSGPSMVYTKDRDEEIANLVIDTANQISERLGYWKDKRKKRVH